MMAKCDYLLHKRKVLLSSTLYKKAIPHWLGEMVQPQELCLYPYVYVDQLLIQRSQIFPELIPIVLPSHSMFPKSPAGSVNAISPGRGNDETCFLQGTEVTSIQVVSKSLSEF